MKKYFVYFVLILALAAAFTLTAAGCAGAPAEKPLPPVGSYAGPAPSANKTKASPARSTIVDWNNRNLGQADTPPWLRAYLINNREDLVRQEFNLPDGTVIRVGQAERPDREEARVLAGLMFSQKIANELKQYVVSGQAASLSQGQMQIVEQVTNAAKVTVTGARALPDFWQCIEKDDNGVKTRSYIWYTVYAIDANTWNQVVAKYLYDVAAQITDPAVKQQIANSFNDIDLETKQVNIISDEEFRQKLDLMNKQVDNFQKQTTIGSNQQTVQAAANTTDANALKAAYASGNPGVVAATSLTPNDTDWVKALGTMAATVF
ncbi:MAG: hypothetical protein FWD78_16325 [Treponema sp.]|nr:hypothetical protein [Treponema sp.]